MITPGRAPSSRKVQWAHIPSQGTLPACFTPHTINKCPFLGKPSDTFQVFFPLIWLFKTAPKQSALVLSCVPKAKKLGYNGDADLSVIQLLGKLRQESYEFKGSLSSTVSLMPGQLRETLSKIKK